jgi:CHRD domain
MSVATGEEDPVRKTGLVAGVVVATLAVGVIAASPVAGATTLKAKKQLIARMNGDKEVPGPGDGNGKGRALITPYVKKRRICFDLKWKRIKGPLMGHIHRGGPKVAGDIKVTLFDVDDPLPGPTAEGCVKKIKRSLVWRIKNYPKRYYVNLHNEKFPAGAIRGQLKLK